MKMYTSIVKITFILALLLTWSSCTIKYTLQETAETALKQQFGSTFNNPHYKIKLVSYTYYNKHIEDQVILSENSALIAKKKGYFQPDTLDGNYDWQEMIIFFGDPPCSNTDPCSYRQIQDKALKKYGTPVYLVSLKGRVIDHVKKYAGIYIFEGIVECAEPGINHADIAITNIQITKHYRWFPNRKGELKTKVKPEFKREYSMSAMARILEDKVIVEALIDRDYLTKGNHSIMYDMEEMFGEKLEFIRDVQR